jgi:guanine nucleotide-binding protein subunit beta-2-like 1 protein
MSEHEKISIEYLGALKGHNGWVTSLAVGTKDDKPFLVSGSRDRNLIVWDLDLEAGVGKQVDEVSIGKPLKSLKGHNHFVSCLALTPDNKHVISGSWDKTLRLWDLTSYKTKQVFVGHTKDVISVGWSSDSRMIYSGSMDKTVKIWNVQGKNQHTSTDFDGWVSSISVKQLKEGPLIAVGSWDNKVRFFDKDFKNTKTIGSSDFPVVSIATDAQGEYLFVAEKNGKVKIWGLSNDPNVADELKTEYDTGVDLHAISYDNKYLGTFQYGSSEGLIIRELSENKCIYSFSYGKNNACLSLSFDPTKKYLFAGFADGTIRVYKFSIA